MKKRICCAMLAGALLCAGTAFAGPQMTFGPDDKGALQIDYKGQFQMTARDIGSGANNDDLTTNFNFRRNRLAFLGRYGDGFSLYVQTEYAEDQNIGALDLASANQGAQFHSRLSSAVGLNGKGCCMAWFQMAGIVIRRSSAATG